MKTYIYYVVMNEEGKYIGYQEYFFRYVFSFELAHLFKTQEGAEVIARAFNGTVKPVQVNVGD